MKTIVSILLLGTVLLSGCARRYVITQNNGATISTRSKPKLKNGSYVYRDFEGRTTSIPAGSVRQIAPASMAKDDSQQFNPNPR